MSGFPVNQNHTPRKEEGKLLKYYYSWIIYSILLNTWFDQMLLILYHVLSKLCIAVFFSILFKELYFLLDPV